MVLLGYLAILLKESKKSGDICNLLPCRDSKGELKVKYIEFLTVTVNK